MCDQLSYKSSPAQDNRRNKYIYNIYNTAKLSSTKTHIGTQMPTIARRCKYQQYKYQSTNLNNNYLSNPKEKLERTQIET